MSRQMQECDRITRRYAKQNPSMPLIRAGFPYGNGNLFNSINVCIALAMNSTHQPLLESVEKALFPLTTPLQRSANLLV
jgi:hypothetical protein